MVNEGDKAPAFTLKDQNGKKIKLSDFKGKKVVVYFYPKDNTPGCTVEACGFRDAYPEFKKNKIIVLGISKDSEKSHKKFSNKFNLNFSILSDPKGKICEKYDSFKEKHMFGKRYLGVVRNTFLIDEKGKIVKIFKRVNPLGHEKQVLEAFRNL